MKLGLGGVVVGGFLLLTLGGMWSDNPDFVWKHFSQAGNAEAGIAGAGVNTVRSIGNQIGPILGNPVPPDTTTPAVKP